MDGACRKPRRPAVQRSSAAHGHCSDQHDGRMDLENQCGQPGCRSALVALDAVEQVQHGPGEQGHHDGFASHGACDGGGVPVSGQQRAQAEHQQGGGGHDRDDRHQRAQRARGLHSHGHAHLRRDGARQRVAGGEHVEELLLGHPCAAVDALGLHQRNEGGPAPETHDSDPPQPGQGRRGPSAQRPAREDRDLHAVGHDFPVDQHLGVEREVACRKVVTMRSLPSMAQSPPTRRGRTCWP